MIAAKKQLLLRLSWYLIHTVGLLLSLAALVCAETITGGLLSQNSTLKFSDSPFLATSDLIIDNGALLTVEAGVIVRFQTGTRLIVKNGSLRAIGTSSAPILLTSWRATPGGLPASNDWGGVQFLDQTNDVSTLLEYVTVSFGTTATLVGASPTFNNCRFENNSGYAISIDLASFPHGAGNRAQGNGFDKIRVASGEMTATGTWDFTAIPYHLYGQVSIGIIPKISTITPSAIEQGGTASVVISGVRLSGAQSITFDNPAVTGEIQAGGTDTSVPVRISVGSAVPFGTVGFGMLVSAGAPTFASGITVIPPLPHITSLVPARIYVNRPDSTIELSGWNFQADSVITFGGVPLATTFVDASTLRGTVPLQTLQGVRPVQVRNPDPRQAGNVITSNSIDLSVELPQLVLAPDPLTIRQGETGTLTLGIPFAAPAGGVTVNMISTDPATVTVPAMVTIPAGTTSTTVRVTALKTAQNRDVTVEVHANKNNWLGAKVKVTSHPQPSVNMTPTTALTGQGTTMFITVSITDPAPVGGVEITFSSTTQNIISFPAKVTIPQGSTSAQITVTALSVGTAILSSSGNGFAQGDSCLITVRPIQIYDVGPILSESIEVQLGTTGTPPVPTTYGPVVSLPVDIQFGPVITGVIPDRAAVGSSGLRVRITGNNLTETTSLQFVPADGITIQDGSLVKAPDGSSVEVLVNIASDAPAVPRTVVVSTLSGVAMPTAADVNIFKVTLQAPEITMLLPNYGSAGSSLTMKVYGRNLQGATSIEVLPPAGISVQNPPTVTGDGTMVTVNLNIGPDAAPGPRVVTVTTPGGTSTTTPTATNGLNVLPTTGTSPVQLLSSEVEVQVQSSTPPRVTSTYGPVMSLPVDIQIGPVITGVLPDRAAVGSNGVRIRITGNSLNETTSVQFVPADGITIQDGSLVKAPDGSSVEVLVNIASDAPVTPRTVVVTTLSGVAMPAAAGVNTFTVTLQVPEITTLLPNYGSAGSSHAIKVYGRNLQGATWVEVLPPAGISVQNPPTVTGDGAIITVNLTISPDAAPGSRVVTITTPGGASTTIPSATNSLNVLPATGTSPVQLVSSEVEVQVHASTPPPVTSTYGPVVSTEVEVYLAPPTPPPVKSDYGPALSLPVEVTIGTSITRIAPLVLEPASSGTIIISGSGLSTVGKIELVPSEGITIGAWNANQDGTSISVSVAVSAASPLGPRQFLLSTTDGHIRSAFVILNPLLVGSKPVIASLNPIIEPVGTVFTLTIHGTNLSGSTQVRFEPPNGINVDTIPVVNSDGTLLSVNVQIDGTATGGDRIVIVTTQYGSSATIATAANTFRIYRPVVQYGSPLQPVVARKTSQPLDRIAEHRAGAICAFDESLPFAGIEGRRTVRKSTSLVMPIPGGGQRPIARSINSSWLHDVVFLAQQAATHSDIVRGPPWFKRD